MGGLEREPCSPPTQVILQNNLTWSQALLLPRHFRGGHKTPHKGPTVSPRAAPLYPASSQRGKTGEQTKGVHPAPRAGGRGAQAWGGVEGPRRVLGFGTHAGAQMAFADQTGGPRLGVRPPRPGDPQEDWGIGGSLLGSTWGASARLQQPRRTGRGSRVVPGGLQHEAGRPRPPGPLTWQWKAGAPGGAASRAGAGQARRGGVGGWRQCACARAGRSWGWSEGWPRPLSGGVYGESRGTQRMGTPTS